MKKGNVRLSVYIVSIIVGSLLLLDGLINNEIDTGEVTNKKTSTKNSMSRTVGGGIYDASIITILVKGESYSVQVNPWAYKNIEISDSVKIYKSLLLGRLSGVSKGDQYFSSMGFINLAVKIFGILIIVFPFLASYLRGKETKKEANNV